jgi:hypothetical protein
MGMQKYRADTAIAQTDGATLWYAKWLGGPSLARINNCRLESLAGNIRVTVYITGEADTWFSQPAYCSLKGCRVRGYVTTAETGDLVFHHCYF